MFELRDQMLVEFDVQIHTDDGATLSADIFRPDNEEQAPALVSYGPYAKGLHFEDGYADQWRIMCEKFPEVAERSSNLYQSWEIADPEKWVSRGYALVRVDSRGAGRSPGVIDSFSNREADDLYECIEWCARQPWCSGKVGLSGISYYAVNQWQVAAKQPPHLAAICPWEGFADHYRDLARHGGILSTFGENWYPAQVETVQYGLGERGQRSRVTGKLVAGDRTLSTEELVHNRVDYGQKMLMHTLDDAHYDERTPDLSRIEVPLLSAGNWGGHGLHLRGNTEGYLQASSEQKWLEIHGLEHWVHYYTDYGRELQLAFFDHFLHGHDNGWDERPPVHLNVRKVDGTFVPRDEDAWPISRTRWTRLYLDASSSGLLAQPATHPSSASYLPLEGQLRFTAEIDEETEITGPMAAKLFVSTASEDADLFLIVQVFDTDGEEVTFQGALEPHSPFAHGWLRLSHRELDLERSLEYRPYHRHIRQLSVTPGEIYEVDVEIWPSCLVVPPGYTLALTVQGRDYQFSDDVARVSWFTMTGVGPFKHDDPRDRPPETFGAEVTIHTGGVHGSSLLVPIVPTE